MLDLLNKIASMEFPRIQKQNEKLVREYMAESIEKSLRAETCFALHQGGVQNARIGIECQ